MDIQEIILKAKAGDINAQEDVLVYYNKEIVDIASGYKNIEGYDFEDLVQEGKILLTKLISLYDENKGPLGALLRTALNNKFVDMSRKKVPVTVSITGHTSEEQEANEYISSIPSDDPSPFDMLARMDEMKAFYKSLEELLSPDQYAVMCLYLQNYSYREIADKLGLTTKKVDNLILASKKKIKNSNILK